MSFVASAFQRCSRELKVPKPSGSPKSVKFNVDGNYCMTCGSDRLVHLWNPHTGKLLKTYTGHGLDVLDSCASQDNSKIASGGEDKTVIYWDVATGNILRKFRGHIGSVNCLTLSHPDSTVIISGSFDATVCCWDCRSRRKEAIQTMKEAKDSVQALQVTESEILVGSVDGYTRIYDIRNGKMIEDCLGEPVTSASFTQDGQCLLVSTLDSVIRLIDKDNGELLNSYRGHKNTEYKVESGMSHDDTTIISGSEDGRLLFWDLVDGKVAHEITNAHVGVVYSLAVHPTQNCFLTAGMDTVKFWQDDTDREN